MVLFFVPLNCPLQHHLCIYMILRHILLIPQMGIDFALAHH